MRAVTAVKAPKAVGPYSQGIESGGFVFCSGQIGIDPKSGNMLEGIEKQAHQVLRNLDAVLEAGGTDKSLVVKTTIFLKHIDDFAHVNEIYSNYFTTDPKPARETVGVSDLPKGALIEISAIAVKKA